MEIISKKVNKYYFLNFKGVYHLINKLYRVKIGKSREKLRVVKKVQYHPELIDIEVYNFLKSGSPKLEVFENLKDESYDSVVSMYIPLLLYDDLEECMLQNLNSLQMNEKELLNPTSLLERNVILLLNSKEVDIRDLSNYSWLTNLNEVNLEGILQSLS